MKKTIILFSVIFCFSFSFAATDVNTAGVKKDAPIVKTEKQTLHKQGSIGIQKKNNWSKIKDLFL